MQFFKRWLRIERPESAAITPSRKLVIAKPYGEVFNRTVEGIERVLGGVVRESDPKTGTVEATFGLTFGERLSCSLEANGENETAVRITSRRGVQAQAHQRSQYVDALADFLQTTG